MFLSFSGDTFTLLLQNSVMVVSVCLWPPRQVGAHLHGHQHGDSIQISINDLNLGEGLYIFTFFLYWTVLIFSLIWRDTENQK